MAMMARYPDKFFDTICDDPPYGNTKLKWDFKLDWDKYFELRWRLLKDNGCFLVFSQQPYATDVINACRKWFRYEIVWQKTQLMGFLDANRRPLRAHELILIFYKKQPFYNPVKSKSETSSLRTIKEGHLRGASHYNEFKALKKHGSEDNMRYPSDVITFSNWNGAIFGDTTNKSKHPTQKPVPLYDYLYRTYCDNGNKILDTHLGSGSSRIAAYDLGFDFYGCELDKDYYDAQEKRFAIHIAQQKLFAPERAVAEQINLL